MRKPEVEVIKLTEDITLSSPGCGVCTGHCTPIQTECTPICQNDDPAVCDCVDGWD